MGEIIDNRSFESAIDETLTSESTEQPSSAESTEASQPVVTETKTPESNESSQEGEQAKAPEEDTSHKENDQKEPEAINKEEKEPRSVKRVKRLLQERAELRAELEKERLRAAQPAPPIVTPAADINPDVVSQIVEERLAQEREAQFAREMSEAWDDDISHLVENNELLNPDSDKFDQDLSDTLIDLIKKANLDENGKMAGRVFPSEIWAGMQKTFESAKKLGSQEAIKKVSAIQDTAAVQDNVSAEKSESRLTDEEITRLQIADPRKYTEMVQKGLI